MLPEEVINVSSKSSTNDLAQTITSAINEMKTVVLKTIGAGAVNQAVKGIAVAEQNGLNLNTTFSFFTVMIQGMEKTGIVFRVTNK